MGVRECVCAFVCIAKQENCSFVKSTYLNKMSFREKNLGNKKQIFPSFELIGAKLRKRTSERERKKEKGRERVL